MNLLGVDLGGTKIEAILLGADHNTIQRTRVHTPKSYDGILSSIVELVADVGDGDFSIGVCTPGVIARDTGRIKNSNTQCIIGRPLQKDLEQMLRRHISMMNDANCFAMAEAVMGAAQGYDTVFGTIMGTGVGGGIVINGEIHHGRTDTAGEWGHHTLHRGGNRCYCGNLGCVETYISGPALERRWQEITGQILPLKEIVKRNDSCKFAGWKNEFLDNFGIALANVIDILDPDAIVLGGGVSNVPFLYDEGRRRVLDCVFGDMIDTPILHNRLGDSGGVYGAALLGV